MRCWATARTQPPRRRLARYAIDACSALSNRVAGTPKYRVCATSRIRFTSPACVYPAAAAARTYDPLGPSDTIELISSTNG